MLEELKTELIKRGFSAEICKDFVAVKFTPKADKIGYALHGLEVHFNKRLVKSAQTDKGFYLAFQP